MKLQFVLLLALGTMFCSAALASPRKSPGRHWVKTYTRKNGTVVQGHWAGSGFLSTTPSRSTRSGHSAYVPGSIGDFIRQDGAHFSQSTNTNTSDHLYDTYAQDPTLEPSWIREQRRENAEQAATEQSRKDDASSKKKHVRARRK